MAIKYYFYKNVIEHGIDEDRNRCVDNQKFRSIELHHE